jgi:drug/metabolite transporter (DMT)-like permease
MSISRNLAIGLLFLALAQIMTATNIVGSKYLVAFLPIVFLLTIRFTLSFVILGSLHWILLGRKNKLSKYFEQLDKKDWLVIVAQAVCAGVLFNFLMLLGLHYTDANIAGIITSALPAIIAIISWIVLREKITFKKGLCIFFATLGLLVISIGKLQFNGNHLSLLGVIIILLSLLPEAGYYVLSKVHPNRLPVFLISAILNGINALILWPLLFFFINWHTLHISGFLWLILIIVGLTSGLFYTFWFLGSHRVDATLASLSTAFMPVMTVLIAWLALAEKINGSEFLGMSLVIISVIIYAMG